MCTSILLSFNHNGVLVQLGRQLLCMIPLPPPPVKKFEDTHRSTAARSHRRFLHSPAFEAWTEVTSLPSYE